MCMLSWNIRSNKPLKVPSDLITEGLIFQNFLGGMPPDPLDLACYTCQNVCSACTLLSCSLQYICAPPFVNPGSAPELSTSFMQS